MHQQLQVVAAVWQAPAVAGVAAVVDAGVSVRSRRIGATAAASRGQLPPSHPPARPGALPVRPRSPSSTRFHRTPTLLRILRRMDFWRGPTSNTGLVKLLQNTGCLFSERVTNVMKQLDRGLFVPDRENPYSDNPVPIGYNATISAPHMHAECLQLLEGYLQPGMHALDVGSGTGYLTAAFALLVGEQGRAVGVEHIPELVQQSVLNVQKSVVASQLASGSLSLHAGDGREGWPECAPYNAIHVGAAAERIPEALIEQLKVGGRMVIPVGDIFQDLKVIDKEADGSIKESTVTAVRYVPLTDRVKQLKQ